MREQTLDRAVSARAASQHGLLTRSQAIDLGFSRSAAHRRTTNGTWIPVHPGVYRVAGAPFTWHTRVLAACLATGGMASHQTSAVLHHIPDFRPGQPVVTVPRGTRPRLAGVAVHESLDVGKAHTVRIDGVPTTDVRRLAVDLGGVCTFRRYELAMEHLIGQGSLTWESLLHVLLDHSIQGRTGCGALRALLTERYGEVVSDSALERAFVRLLTQSGLPMPKPQHEIFDRVGFVARVDYAYPELLVAIELDSKEHHLHEVAFEEDPRKRNRLKLAGWLVLEFTWRMLFDHPGRVLAECRQAIDQGRHPT